MTDLYILEANAQITKLRDRFDLQAQEINRFSTIQNRPLTVNVEAISDLLPDSFLRIDDNVDFEDFFQEICIHRAMFPVNQTKLEAIMHCLKGPSPD